jgi:cyclopropane fatty-acyl-phospholipid synthase-like methyltransferase
MNAPRKQFRSSCSASRFVFFQNEWDRFYSRGKAVKEFPSEDVVRVFSKLCARGVITTDMSLADLGCGNGRFWPFFIRSGWSRIHGIDNSRAAFDLFPARDHSEEICSICSNLFDVPGTFDILLAWGLLDHVLLEQVPEYVKRLSELLSPRGVCYIAVKGTQEFHDPVETINPASHPESGIPHLLFPSDFLPTLFQKSGMELLDASTWSWKFSADSTPALLYGYTFRSGNRETAS